VPQLGVELSMRLDGLSLLFGLLIAGIGTFVAIYAGGYLAGDRQLPRFYLLLSPSWRRCWASSPATT
jgi:multicomponent Na+:H+ antiporter subunit A